MSKKSCELCKKQATMFCESDQASLCWDCDEKVHSANFLVAKHSRTLLCHVCCSPTSWNASGLKLGPTFSVCQSCSDSTTGNKSVAQSVLNYQESETDDNGEYCSDSDYYSEEENGDNQVVPWENSSKRMHESDACEDGCCSNSKLSAESDQSSYQVDLDYDGNDGSSSTSLLRPLKTRRMRDDHGSSVWDEWSS